MKETFVSGPWEIIQHHRDKSVSIRQVGGHAPVVYRVDTGTGFHVDRMMATAQVIVNSPDMLKMLETLSGDFYPCEECNGTGYEDEATDTACRTCGGYGFNPGGDIRDHIVEARNIIKKAIGKPKPLVLG